jgi:hypothetical protein
LIGKFKSIKPINKHFILQPRDVSILKQDNNAVIVFDQIAAVNSDGSFQGSFNKLVLEKINNKWQIIDDVTALAMRNKKLAHIDQTKLPIDNSISDLVNKWVTSWKSGDMQTYRSCYATDFESKGMNLDNWIIYKTDLRKYSKIIDIRVDDLSVSIEGNRATAVFIQDYNSSTIKSKGKKKLELLKINEEWKIYRERM